MRVICIDDVFTEHEQAFVRYDLETAWDDSGIIGLFETKDEADAHAAYATHEYCRAMTVVE